MRFHALPLAALLALGLQGCIGIPQRELVFDGVVASGCRTYAGEKWEWRYCDFSVEPSKVRDLSILLPDSELVPLEEITPELAAKIASGEGRSHFAFHFDGSTLTKVNVRFVPRWEAATPIWVPAFSRTGTKLVYRFPLEERELKELFGRVKRQRDWHELS